MDLEADQPLSTYSAAEVAEMVGVPPERLHEWVGAQLLEPIGEDERGLCFDFSQLSAAKTLSDLSRSGLSQRELRRHVEKLRSWRAEKDGALPAGIDGPRRLLIRLAEGDLAECDGQLRFDFCPDSQPMRLAPRRSEVTAAQWRDLGHEQEADGQVNEAADSYRTALAIGGFDASICFSLAHVLAEAGNKEAAVERYRQVVESDPNHADAWNNLGVVLHELNQCTEGIAAFQRAIEIAPDNFRAHYNLADALDECGRSNDAIPHWRAFLKSNPSGPCAAYARYKCS